MRKISSPPGFDPRTVQPVASRYTDYVSPAHRNRGTLEFKPQTFIKSSSSQKSLVWPHHDTATTENPLAYAQTPLRFKLFGVIAQGYVSFAGMSNTEQGTETWASRQPTSLGLVFQLVWLVVCLVGWVFEKLWIFRSLDFSCTQTKEMIAYGHTPILSLQWRVLLQGSEAETCWRSTITWALGYSHGWGVRGNIPKRKIS